MKLHTLTYLLLATIVLSLSACTKFSTDNNSISMALKKPTVPLLDSASGNTLCGSVSGTMLAGKTYIINCDLYVNEGDSLVIQPGARLIFKNQAGMIVRGSLFSLGSQRNPIYFGVDGQVKTDNPVKGFKAKNDSAFKGLWRGIAADVTCNYLVFKWTHIEYCGAIAGNDSSAIYNVEGIAKTANAYGIFFSNFLGYFVFEDSWMYGSVDDAIRIGGSGGKFAILRSTFEKCGKSGGDILNIKAGGVGDMAYNFFIGGATNSLKAANSGTAPGIPNCEARVYNNTIINSGYRQTKSGRGGSINYENGARGQVFNNLIVNCKYGLRLNSNVPDTAYMYAGNYGYNYYWASDSSVANQIFPFTPGAVTKPVETDFPKPSTYLPPNYTYTPANVAYDGTKAVQVGNPLFTNYPLPVSGGYGLADITAIGKFAFTLQPNSPCIGVGYTGFSPLQVVPTDPVFGVTTFSLPGKDIGAYQINGSGNQH